MAPNKIMIVEDNTTVAEDCRDCLESLGYIVTAVVASGEEAVENAGKERPNAVLMDIRLRGEMDGIEAAEEIHRRFEIPVLFLSAYSDDDLLRRAKSAGSFGYLVKPFEERELAAMLEMTLYKAGVENERRRMTEKLLESEEKYRRLAENSRDMIYRMSLPDGVYEYVSPASVEVFGYPPEAFYENPALIRDVIHPDWLAYFENEWGRLIRGEAPPVYEYQIMHKSGDTRWLHQRNVLVRDDRGRPKAIEGIVTDLTDIKRAEAQLRRHSEALEEMVAERTRKLEETQAELLVKERLAVLGHFAGSISHELRNPLAAIDSSVYCLDMTLDRGDEKARTYLGRISSNVRQSTEIIESLRRLSLMEKPKTGVHVLSRIISNTLDGSRVPDQVSVTLDHPDPEVLVEVDPQQFRLALENIIRNALQAMGGAGELRIAVRRTAGAVDLRIADSGPGISPQNLDKVFDPLFSTKTHGIGFGLSIAKMIIENHGGTIRAGSEPGSGAVFIITLPWAEEPS